MPFDATMVQQVIDDLRRVYLSIEKGVSGAFGEAGSSLTRYNRRFLVSLPVALYR